MKLLSLPDLPCPGMICSYLGPFSWAPKIEEPEEPLYEEEEDVVKAEHLECMREAYLSQHPPHKPDDYLYSSEFFDYTFKVCEPDLDPGVAMMLGGWATLHSITKRAEAHADIRVSVGPLLKPIPAIPLVQPHARRLPGGPPTLSLEGLLPICFLACCMCWTFKYVLKIREKDSVDKWWWEIEEEDVEEEKDEGEVVEEEMVEPAGEKF